MNKQYTILVISILIFVSCGNTKLNRKASFTSLHKLQQNQSIYPSFLIDFFPKNVGTEGFVLKTTDITNECVYMIYYDKVTSDRILSIENASQKKSIAIYNATDPNLVSIRCKSIIHEDPSMEMFYDKIKKGNLMYYPTIYFERDSDYVKEPSVIYDSNSQIGLSKDFTVYILDSKAGKFWKGLPPSEHMPKGWENGYTKGICINKKQNLLIYWFVVW